VAEVLLANKANVNAKAWDGSTPLRWAAFYSRKDVAELLLAKGADVNVKDIGGDTPLHHAASRKDMVELLLANKADVNAKDNSGLTPLRWTEILGHKDIVELLRQHGGHE
jgi:ankyrin repeat protein